MAQKVKPWVMQAMKRVPASVNPIVIKRYSLKAPATGYSLIELMVVVVIAGIISSVAIPSYQSSIALAAKHETVSYLLSLQLTQEHYWLNNGVYAGIANLPAPNIEGLELAELAKADASYKISATLSFLEKNHPCRVLTITPVNSLPDGCWH